MALHDRQVCPGCGLHESVHSDPSVALTFEERLCEVCRGQDVYARVLADRDDKATPRDHKGEPIKQKPTEPRPADGRHVFMRQMSPAEVAQREADKAAKTSTRRRSRRG